jgi:hypothetical protein
MEDCDMTGEISEQELERGLELLNADEADVLSYLGIQAQRLELAEKRLQNQRPVPEWSDEDAFKKVLSPQRAAGDELALYAQRGLAFAERLLQMMGEKVRALLCSGGQVRREVAGLEGDAKAFVKSVASAIFVALLGGLPTLLAKAAASIATTMAVLLMKRRLEAFCAVA